MSGPTLIARILPKAAKAIMGKDKSRARLSMARLVDGWDEIIAPEDSSLVRPVRVGWKWRGEGADKVSEGTLHIAAPSAVAAKLVYQEAVIVARVNRLFGLPQNGCIRRISVSHDRVAPPARPKRRRADVPVADDTRAILEKVEDPVLREKLAGLAGAMAADAAADKLA